MARQDPPQGHHSIFGLANVDVHRVSALVRLHEAGQALHYASSIDPDSLDTLPAERRSNYLLDLADAYSQVGHVRTAIQSLRSAEGIAPEEVRCRPIAHRMIAGLLSTGQGGSDPMLRQIAHRAGVAA